MKKNILGYILLTTLLCSCSNDKEFKKILYFFDTYEEIILYEDNKEVFSELSNTIQLYDNLTDNYHSSQKYTNIFDINLTNGTKTGINKELYDLFKNSEVLQGYSKNYYNPLIGKISNLYKESLQKNVLPDQAQVSEYLVEMNNTELILEEENNKYFVTKNGSAEIDFGAIAKGYVLDKCYDYLSTHDITNYLVNCGLSSLLLGSKKSANPEYSVGFSFKKGAYISARECFIGVSGVQEQGVKIDGVTYSHIINPFTGSAVNNYDAVVVLGSSGSLCDVLSTSFMMMSLDEIKQIESELNVSSIIFKDNEFLYINENLEVKYH